MQVQNDFLKFGEKQGVIVYKRLVDTNLNYRIIPWEVKVKSITLHR